MAACLASAGSASADPETWLTSLTDRVIGDLAAGKPLVVEVHVPLCERTIIRCGNDKLGDGDNLETNLLWSTTPGFGEWFGRRGAGWSHVAHTRGAATGSADVLAIEVYRKTVPTPAAWRTRGAPARFELDIVIHGWRGKAIDAALASYAAEISGGPTRAVKLTDGTTLAAGGAAQIIAFVGHNRLMDLDRFDWPKPGSKATGTIAIACETAAYMEDEVAGPTRVPLLMTRDLLFSNAAPLEAVVLAFASGGGYARMRADATAAYAKVREIEVKRAGGVFTNPADRRWKNR